MGSSVEPRSSDDPKLSPRAGCGLVAVLGALLFAVLWLGLQLAIRGEINIQNQASSGMRVWLVNDAGNRGVAWSTSRYVPGSDLPERYCLQTTVRFFMWRSASTSPAEKYCDCYAGSAGQWEYVGACNP